MPVRKVREDYTPTTAQPATRLTGNIDGVAAMPSPARSLQQQLEMHAASQILPDVEKWSPRSALAFIVAASAALWMALIVAGAEVGRLIA
jgi:hypothetical protein